MIDTEVPVRRSALDKGPGFEHPEPMDSCLHLPVRLSVVAIAVSRAGSNRASQLATPRPAARTALEPASVSDWFVTP